MFSVPKNSDTGAVQPGGGLKNAYVTRWALAAFFALKLVTRRAESQQPPPARASHPPLFFSTENPMEGLPKPAGIDFFVHLRICPARRPDGFSLGFFGAVKINSNRFQKSSRPVC